MKKIFYTSLLVAGIMLAGTTVNAQVASSQSATGKTVNIPDTNGSGPGLNFDPSPNNVILVSSTTNAFAITAMNTSAANGDRMEYGVWSGLTGYYQGVNPDVTGTPDSGDLSVQLDATTTLTTTPFSGSTWVAMGGGGS